MTTSDLLNQVLCVDAIDLLKMLDANSVDAFITDLPYQLTGCKWDKIIPFEPMWEGVCASLKTKGAFVSTATEPFTSKLIMSNLPMYRYKWGWDKIQGSDFQLAKLRPMTVLEDIVVFSKSKTANGAKENMNYYPQMERHLKPVKSGGAPKARYLNPHNMVALRKTYENKYPTNLLRFSKEKGKNRFHPTQKPLSLIEYLIKTYTNEGDLVVDFCCGSGTTAIAAQNLGRNFIVNDNHTEYYEYTKQRLSKNQSEGLKYELPSV